MGKGIRGNSHAVWFHTAPPTRHGQNHHQSAIKSYNSRRQAVASVTMESSCQPPSSRQCRYGSLWLHLNLQLRPPKTIASMFMVIDDSICIILITTNQSSSINWPQFDGMCKATTPAVKQRCETSQWKQVGDVARFGGGFERISS